MRSLRKLALLGLGVLMLAVAVASAASADTLENASTSATIPVGDTITGSSSNTQLSGTFFFIAQTLQCGASSVSGPTTKTSGAGAVTGNITSISFTSCKNINNNNNCTVTSNASSSNTALLSAAAGGAVNVTLNSVTVTVKNGCFTGQSSDCAFTSSASTIPGTFTNASPPTPANIGFHPSSSNVKSTACGINGKWSGDYSTKDTTQNVDLKVV